jgi:two-component system C4-dicarboxylate transport sensor histidine kinase DctB
MGAGGARWQIGARTEGTEEMNRQNRDEEVTRETWGEGGRLSSHCTDIECLDRLDRLELASLLSAGLAHDLASPLVAFHVDLTRLSRWLDELEEAARPASGAHAGRVGSALARCRWVAGSLDKTTSFMQRLVHDFGRATLGEAAPEGVADVREAIETAVRFAQGVVGNRALITMKMEPRLRAGIDERTLIRALVNLTVNAAEAFASSSTRNQVELLATATDRTLTIDVVDNGRGISAEMRERLFQPLATTKRGERVRGLGLAVARTLLREAGGDLELLATGPSGSTFRCTLPRAVN